MAKSKITLKLKNKKVIQLTEEELEERMGIAAVFLRDKVKLKLNRGQPTRITAGGNIIGLDPSKPGEPPKKVTSQYQNSIVHAVEKTKYRIMGLVGTNMKKGPALELGNKDGTLKPRPHFRPALRENSKAILDILAKGFGGIR